MRYNIIHAFAKIISFLSQDRYILLLVSRYTFEMYIRVYVRHVFFKPAIMLTNIFGNSQVCFLYEKTRRFGDNL